MITTEDVKAIMPEYLLINIDVSDADIDKIINAYHDGLKAGQLTDKIVLNEMAIMDNLTPAETDEYFEKLILSPTAEMSYGHAYIIISNYLDQLTD